MKPSWLQQFDEFRQGKTRGYILEGNTADKVFHPESGTPPIPLKYFLAANLGKEGYSVGHYSLANGFEELRAPGMEKRSGSLFASLPHDQTPDQVLAHMTRWLRDGKNKVALVLDYADHLAPASNGMNAMVGQMHLAVLEVLHSWGMDENIRSTDNLILLVSYESQVSELLLRGGVGYKRLDLSLPSDSVRQQFLEVLAANVEGEEAVLSEIPLEELTRMTSGLPLVEIEELMMTALRRQAPLDRTQVQERKSAVIDQLCRGLLEVHTPSHGFERVVGLEHAVDELSRVVQAVRLNPQSAPQALLLVGVPGCGKSYLVGALARELGYPCLAMRNVREGLVGASERNLERVLWVAETLSPCLMWIDEIDQVMGQRTTGQTMDGGTSERMMARIWEFMGSGKHRGQILWVGTSNRPDLMDQALLDRFQLVLPFLHPGPREVAELLPELARQVGRQLEESMDRSAVASLHSLKNPTVRGLQEVVARAGSLTDVDTQKAGSPIDYTHLEEAALDYKPNYNPLQHQFIALNAVRMASFSSLLPWRARRGVRSQAHIPDYLIDVVDSDSGELDQVKLNQQLARLSSALRQDAHERAF